jgi:hypothetical protein
VNVSDSDVGSFSEPSESDTCNVNLPFSSSGGGGEEEEVVQPKPGRGRKKNAGPFLNQKYKF